jgi:peptidoglycan glycosyltransferase
VNVPLRRVAIAVALLFLALLVNANYVQVVDATSLSHNPHNSRLLIDSYSRQRGDILDDGQAVAASVPTKDTLKYLRTYPGGALFAPVTGYYSLVYGTTGLESSQNELLAGTAPELTISRLSSLFSGRSTVGGDVLLTLDKAAQTAAYQALAGRTGAVVALDPQTGAVLALATSPSYNPAPLSSHSTATELAYWKQLTSDPTDPMLDRATQDFYPPGSTFKIVTLAAALSGAGYTPKTQVPDPSSLALPDTTHRLHNFDSESCSSGPTQSLTDALVVSCDTAFAAIGLRLGLPTVQAEAARFGVGSTVPHLGIAQTASKVPTPPAGNPEFAAYDAIGQGDTVMTPLQMAMVTEAVADGGTEMTPYLVARTEAPNLTTLSTTSPTVYAHPMSAAVAGEISTMMTAVVTRGTGSAVALPGVQIAAKTGTAQTNGSNLDDWFVAFAPVAHPTIALAVVVLDQPGNAQTNQGGVVAAPIAKAVLSAYLAGARSGP